jgi:hypothetical protein
MALGELGAALRPLDADRAHLKPGGLRFHRARRAVVALHHGAHRVRVAQHRQHDVRAAGGLAGRVRDRHPVVRQRFRLFTSTVPCTHIDPRAGQVAGHGETHGPARAEKSDRHDGTHVPPVQQR